MEIDNNGMDRELTRTGRRGGCSCCSFTLMSLVALPILAAASFFLIF